MSRVLSLLLLIACDDKSEELEAEEPLPADTAEPQEEEVEEEIEEEEEPEDTSMSSDDTFSQEACELLEGESEELILAASESEAAQLTILSDGTPHRLVMPEKGDGWLVLEMPEWMAYLRIFTDEGVTYEFDLAEQMTDAKVNGACPDAGISDQSWAIHSWGSYPIQFHEGPEEIWFVVLEE